MSQPPNPYLPDELVNEILLRLPVKPISRFKCVSKPWRSLLSSPQFTRDHLKLHADDPQEFILSSSSPDSDYAPYILTLGAAAANDGVARKVRFQSEQNVWPEVAGSCDGLVLLLMHDVGHDSTENFPRKMMLNPITSETAEVRDDRPLNQKNAKVHDCVIYNQCTYGFGYDSSSGDYKIVSLSYTAGMKGSLVEVYSLRMKSWKRIMNCPYILQNSPYDGGPGLGVFLNGCVHWYGKDSRNLFGSHELVCFDLAREKFVLGLLPAGVGQFVFEIKVLKGCLALVSDPHYTVGFVMNVWVMKEYGVPASWTKFAAISPEKDFEYNVVCVLNEEEMVLEKDYRQLFAYNRNDRVSRDLVIAGLPKIFHRVMPFRGSLLSPN